MTTNKKVALVGCAGIPASYGGFETLAEHLTRRLGEQFDFTVYCSGKNYRQRQPSHNNARLYYVPLGSNGKQSILYDFLSMVHALRYADIMLILGVSGCIFLPLVRLLFRGKIIVNIDGVEWKRDKWRWYAKLFLRLSEAFAVWFSDTIIADHPIIQAYVKNTYGRESQYIAYGADHVERRPLSDEVVRQYPFLKEPYALSVCRIEPENNVRMILDAMTRPGMMNFVIIGNWSGNRYARELKEQCLRYSNVHMLDPIYDQKILDQFRSNCAVYIHGHSAGGTNPSLIEMLALGGKIIAFKVNYNLSILGSLSQSRSFSTAAELCNRVKCEVAASTQVSSMVNEKSDYAWQSVSGKYAQLFNGLV